MTDSNVTPLNGSDTGSEDQKQHELSVSGTGSLVAAMKALMQGRDQLLVNAINFKIGEGWTLTDVIKRGEFIIKCGGFETFTFDGAPLVNFWPHETTMLANSLTITQKYRKLYSNKGLH